MTFDHRTLPDIEWVSSPGPLRVGDYYRGFEQRVYKISPLDVIDTDDVDPDRVIPHVRPLEVPEPCEPEAPEVITWTSPVCGTFRIGNPATTGFDGDGAALGDWFFEDELIDATYVVNVCAGGARHEAGCHHPHQFGAGPE